MRLMAFHRVEVLAEPLLTPPLPDVLYLFLGEIGPAVGFLCPCGCKTWTYLRIKEGACGPDREWGYSFHDGKLSLTPSVLDRRCKSHFFIRENRVEWC